MPYALNGSPIDPRISPVRVVRESEIFRNVVAVRNNGVAWSPDGINWTAGSIPAQSWVGVAYAGSLGRYAAISNSGGGNNIATSDDGGATWTLRTIPVNITFWIGIAWSPVLKRFSCQGSGGGTSNNHVVFSDDGITWFQGTQVPQAGLGRNLKWGGGRYIGCGGGGTTGLFNSFDGASWVLNPLNAGLSAAPVARVYAQGRFYAGWNIFNTRMFSSSDGGITDPWVRLTNPDLPVAFNDMAYSPRLNLLCAVGDAGVIYTSNDGAAWTARTAPDTNNGRSIIWVDRLGLFIVITSGSSTWHSSNGINWSAGTIGGSNWNGIASLLVDNP